MEKNLYRLINKIKAYEWGTEGVLSNLFKINLNIKGPQAEIWVGAHPAFSSLVQLAPSLAVPLDEWISRYLEKDPLPFLFKILSASKPLSIQCHPNKIKAKEGFLKENLAGIPLDDFKRNYKDDNHKPEILIALTDFVAMVGIKPAKLVRQELRKIGPNWNALIDKSGAIGSRKEVFDLYLKLLGLDEKSYLLNELISFVEDKDDPQYKEVVKLNEIYSDSLSVVSPLVFNLFYLSKGDSLFIPPGTPHAYMRGTGVEVMACSDNVIRAGLTNKYIDINELRSISSIMEESNFTIRPSSKFEGHYSYQVPVNDFVVDMVNSSKDDSYNWDCRNMTIIYCLQGTVEISNFGESIDLNPTDAVIVVNSDRLTIRGAGQLIFSSSRV